MSKKLESIKRISREYTLEILSYHGCDGIQREPLNHGHSKVAYGGLNCGGKRLEEWGSLCRNNVDPSFEWRGRFWQKHHSSCDAFLALLDELFLSFPTNQVSHHLDLCSLSNHQFTKYVRARVVI
ncbi:telomere repeat-binding factor 2-like [Gossypium australe]|uniref:Telomere repeat-binding factor 2-like n=1 Tax=Gossypium australe TaxID=47621 RepID=A0A5B6VYJ4_9ROSI|nr:telomere repeat-binding factor 2-like [Gossypium australe]